jgi:hypothetical protein
MPRVYSLTDGADGSLVGAFLCFSSDSDVFRRQARAAGALAVNAMNACGWREENSVPALRLLSDKKRTASILAMLAVLVTLKQSLFLFYHLIKPIK